MAWTFVVRSAERKSPFARRYWVAAKGEPKVLANEDMIYHCGQEGTASAAALQGKASGNIFAYSQSPFDPPAENQGINDLTAVGPPWIPKRHEVDKFYGGFTWELIQRLISKLGSEDTAYAAARQLVLGAATLNPKDTPDAVRLSFLVDRQNGSPFFSELAAAADSRRIPRPASPEDLDNPLSLSVSNGK